MKTKKFDFLKALESIDDLYIMDLSNGDAIYSKVISFSYSSNSGLIEVHTDESQFERYFYIDGNATLRIRLVHIEIPEPDVAYVVTNPLRVFQDRQAAEAASKLNKKSRVIGVNLDQ